MMYKTGPECSHKGLSKAIECSILTCSFDYGKKLVFPIFQWMLYQLFRGTHAKNIRKSFYSFTNKTFETCQCDVKGHQIIVMIESHSMNGRSFQM